ncbi:MAG: hypothetical protein A2915_02655 [Candidatus Yanofskybacteria bacterium RIFCSPLOWO2_01_FULL_41_34]|uniref:Uncharacterized protein n=1 Tax=Candidatus Yanofskybacteria bacterium RIFCSPHIGHO2_01_FULL_41_26 TaxID=1802661 RepID=A0A1F8EEK9_9BACT|nr:MAG: hypothetical protein A2649_03935 [Candidatus Yanofskybacteria bacterium RIFCSPHIGHO2_01_FULL_41_26]OGN20938.1 MAG: hypothetical protein A2915_02655 [Candidatus Yanofskybacteria bacterium RIFCSPLOWO2_01_FULL_41_34]
MSEVKAFTLDGITRVAEGADGVMCLKDLGFNHALVVITEDETEYDIIVLEPTTGKVRVKGGWFTQPTECKLTGATAGGSTLWMNRIAVGWCMEFWLKEHCTVTTLSVKIIGWRINPTITSSTLVH